MSSPEESSPKTYSQDLDLTTDQEARILRNIPGHVRSQVRGSRKRQVRSTSSSQIRGFFGLVFFLFSVDHTDFFKCLLKLIIIIVNMGWVPV
jgi:hypothetical protein